MRAVYCFSGSGHGRAVAEYLAGCLESSVKEMEQYSDIQTEHETVVAVFPIYSDNIPAPAKNFLRGVKCRNIALIAVYGGVSHGNVLTQAAKLCHGTVICGAYITAGHTYLDYSPEFDRAALNMVIQRILNPKPAVLPKKRQSLPGRMFPETRARMLVRIRRGKECDRCGLCMQVCPVSAMDYDAIGRKCLRCLRCVKMCPKGALHIFYAPFLRTYLKWKHQNKNEIYL